MSRTRNSRPTRSFASDTNSVTSSPTSYRDPPPNDLGDLRTRTLEWIERLVKEMQEHLPGFLAHETINLSWIVDRSRWLKPATYCEEGDLEQGTHLFECGHIEFLDNCDERCWEPRTRIEPVLQGPGKLCMQCSSNNGGDQLWDLVGHLLFPLMTIRESDLIHSHPWKERYEAVYAEITAAARQTLRGPYGWPKFEQLKAKDWLVSYKKEFYRQQEWIAEMVHEHLLPAFKNEWETRLNRANRLLVEKIRDDVVRRVRSAVGEEVFHRGRNYIEEYLVKMIGPKSQHPLVLKSGLFDKMYRQVAREGKDIQYGEYDAFWEYKFQDNNGDFYITAATASQYIDPYVFYWLLTQNRWKTNVSSLVVPEEAERAAKYGRIHDWEGVLQREHLVWQLTDRALLKQANKNRRQKKLMHRLARYSGQSESLPGSEDLVDVVPESSSSGSSSPEESSSPTPEPSRPMITLNWQRHRGLGVVVQMQIQLLCETMDTTIDLNLQTGSYKRFKRHFEHDLSSLFNNEKYHKEYQGQFRDLLNEFYTVDEGDLWKLVDVSNWIPNAEEFLRGISDIVPWREEVLRSYPDLLRSGMASVVQAKAILDNAENIYIPEGAVKEPLKYFLFHGEMLVNGIKVEGVTFLERTVRDNADEVGSGSETQVEDEDSGSEEDAEQEEDDSESMEVDVQEVHKNDHMEVDDQTEEETDEGAGTDQTDDQDVDEEELEEDDDDDGTAAAATEQEISSEDQSTEDNSDNQDETNDQEGIEGEENEEEEDQSTETNSNDGQDETDGQALPPQDQSSSEEGQKQQQEEDNQSAENQSSPDEEEEEEENDQSSSASQEEENSNNQDEDDQSSEASDSNTSDQTYIPTPTFTTTPSNPTNPTTSTNPNATDADADEASEPDSLPTATTATDEYLTWMVVPGSSASTAPAATDEAKTEDKATTKTKAKARAKTEVKVKDKAKAKAAPMAAPPARPAYPAPPRRKISGPYDFFGKLKKPRPD